MKNLLLSCKRSLVVKAHGSHLGTSELVGRAIQKAVADAGFHEGVFSLLIGEGNAIGEARVDHPAIKVLSPNTPGGFMRGVERQQKGSGVTELGTGSIPAKDLDGQACIFEVDTEILLQPMGHGNEVFGTGALLVRCRSFDVQVYYCDLQNP